VAIFAGLGSLDQQQVQTLTAVANIVLTVGLLTFAGLQWAVTPRQLKLQHQAEVHDTDIEQRALERQKREDGAREDAAIATIRAEFYRLYEEYRVLELQGASAMLVAGAIDGPEFGFSDPAYAMSQFAVLGFLSARLGASGISTLNDVVRAIQRLNEMVRLVAGERPRGTSFMYNQVKTNIPDLEAQLDRVRVQMRHGLLTVDDAIHCSPRASVKHTLNWPKELRSVTALSMRENLPGAASDLDWRVGKEGRDIFIPASDPSSLS
jgi:hypothetical protein